MIEAYFRKNINYIDKCLDDALPDAKAYPALIHESMRYMIFSGGKRIRPILTICCCEVCGGKREDVSIPAMAIELIHTFSLIHDDLPCMDNDDFRRGKPTCHKKFGEAFALLAGDALVTYAFELLSRLPANRKTIRIISELTKASGTLGMIGGQVVDKLSENKEITFPVLDYINVNKTGKLIAVSCLIGAIAGRANLRQEKAILKYGEYLGFAFQVIDDIIDGNGYVRFMSKREAFNRAAELIENAKNALKPLDSKTIHLKQIADFVLNRGKTDDKKIKKEPSKSKIIRKG